MLSLHLLMQLEKRLQGKKVKTHHFVMLHAFCEPVDSGMSPSFKKLKCSSISVSTSCSGKNFIFSLFSHSFLRQRIFFPFEQTKNVQLFSCCGLIQTGLSYKLWFHFCLMHCPILRGTIQGKNTVQYTLTVIVPKKS